MSNKFLDIKGTLTFEPDDPPRAPGKYVYQRVQPGLGNVTADKSRSLQLRAHVIPADPATAPQVARRATFAAAVSEWQSLSVEVKKLWNARGKAARLPGYQHFLSRRIRGYVD